MKYLLIVDDGMSFAIRTLLKLVDSGVIKGLSLDHASTYMKGIEFIERTEYDDILVDHLMRDSTISCKEFLEVCKKQEIFAKANVRLWTQSSVYEVQDLINEFGIQHMPKFEFMDYLENWIKK